MSGNVRRLLTKCVIHDKRTILHFIQSQPVTITKNEVNYFDGDTPGPLWIENIETLAQSREDIVRCLDRTSTSMKHFLKQLPIETEYEEILDPSSPHLLSYGGRISILNEGSTDNSVAVNSDVNTDMKLHFCVLDIPGEQLTLRAVLHDAHVKSRDIAAMLGLQSYTESQEISGTFGGITGIVWSPTTTDTANTDTATTDISTTQTTTTEVDHSSRDVGDQENIPTNPDLTSDDIIHSQSPPITETLSETRDLLSDIPSLEEISPDFIAHIADITKDQNSAPAATASPNIWRLLREKRITASMFGVVLRAIDSGKFPDHVYRSLMNMNPDLSHVAPIKWGLDNEINAKLAYEKLTGVSVQASGLWLHSSGILGASPDGLLPDNRGIVEFKCPYTLRDTTVEHAIDHDPKFYLKRNSEGVVNLSKNHAYYHQIQGMLYIIDREYCDFCIWTPLCDPYILRIDRNPDWEACLHKLIHFYFSQFLPRVIGSKEERSLHEGYREVVAELGNIARDAKEKRVERKVRLAEERRGKREEGLRIEEKEGDERSGDGEEELRERKLILSDLPVLSDDEIVKIAALTSSSLDRNPSKLWVTMREHRLTSSSFHLVLNAIHRDSYPTSLYKSIMSEYYMVNTKVAKLTQDHTAKAVRQYECEKQTSVLPSGIWLSSDGILGASVAGLLSDGQGIVDVRCLFKYKDISSLQDIIALNDPNFHLDVDESGIVSVKTRHRIYPKIQGALYFSQRQYCDCITWTQNLYHVTRVELDRKWVEERLPLLREFYVNKLFPKLCDKWSYENVVRDLQRFGLK